MTGFYNWRVTLGLSQEDAAARLGISLSQAGRYDRGQTDEGKPLAPPKSVRLAMTMIALKTRGSGMQTEEQLRAAVLCHAVRLVSDAPAEALVRMQRQLRILEDSMGAQKAPPTKEAPPKGDEEDLNGGGLSDPDEECRARAIG